MSFITNALKALGGFFKDRFSFLSETKIWAVVFLLAIPVGAFLLPSFDIILAGFFVSFSASLISGFLVGEHIAPLRDTKGLGIFDLVTNKANHFDAGRILGHVIFISVLAYAFGPLWFPEILVKSELVGLLGSVGLSLFGAANHMDANSVTRAEVVSGRTKLGLLKWLGALALAALGFFLGTRKRKTSCEEKAKDSRKKAEEKIENTSASDLVNDAPNTGDLSRRKQQLKEELKRELKDILE